MFVIMLDNLVEVHPHHWPLSAEEATLDGIRLRRQHSGNPRTVPRGELSLKIIENKSLINAQTGGVDHGAIYESI